MKMLIACAATIAFAALCFMAGRASVRSSDVYLHHDPTAGTVEVYRRGELVAEIDRDDPELLMPLLAVMQYRD